MVVQDKIHFRLFRVVKPDHTTCFAGQWDEDPETLMFAQNIADLLPVGHEVFRQRHGGGITLSFRPLVDAVKTREGIKRYFPLRTDEQEQVCTYILQQERVEVAA